MQIQAMAPGKRSFCGKKRKFDKYWPKTKQKKDKFDYRNSFYVKERQAKNEEIEARRQILEQEKIRERLEEVESSGDDELDPELAWLAMAGYDDGRLLHNLNKPIATSSESESDELDTDKEIKHKRKIKEKKVKREKEKKVNKEKSEKSKMQNNYESSHEEKEIIISTKIDDNFENVETVEKNTDYLEDPFFSHLHNDMDDELYKAVSTTPQITENIILEWPMFGYLICEIPKPVIDLNNKSIKIKKFLDDDGKQYTNYGKPPHLIKHVDWKKLHIKSQIQNNLIKANHINIKDTIEKNSTLLTPLQRELFSVINNYQDLYYHQRTYSNANEILFVYCLHAINHILKTKLNILHHNMKLAKSKRNDMGEVPDEYRDQGLVRPKVLIIVPFKHSCLKIVEMFISILFGEDKGGSVINKLRFMEDFTGNKLMMPKRNFKPQDYKQTLEGNIDDKFKIGIAITKKTLKLYTNFYSSDIIIGSPLGLRRVVGAEGETERDYDFLASIELLIMDQIDVVLMQNWDHLHQVLDYMHLQPKKFLDINYSRLRSWCVNGWTKYYRQTLIFSSVEQPQINTLAIKHCFNYAGKVKVRNVIEPGSIRQVTVAVPQVFRRFDSSDLLQSIDNRLDFFLKEILPQYIDPIYNHTLIYVPCYYDFLYLRNRLMKEKLSFAQISEYTEDAKVARARDMFFHSDAHFLLYTERWHFWRRTRIKGIRHLIFYQLPTYPHFYSEMCNLMDRMYQNPRAGTLFNMSVTVIYSKFDAIALANVVGHKRAVQMLESDSKVHTINRTSI